MAVKLMLPVMLGFVLWRIRESRVSCCLLFGVDVDCVYGSNSVSCLLDSELMI